MVKNWHSHRLSRLFTSVNEWLSLRNAFRILDVISQDTKACCVHNTIIIKVFNNIFTFYSSRSFSSVSMLLSHSFVLFCILKNSIFVVFKFFHFILFKIFFFLYSNPFYANALNCDFFMLVYLTLEGTCCLCN